jgi:hypothetical protein
MSPVYLRTDLQALPNAYGSKLVKGRSIVPVTKAQKEAVLKANEGILKPDQIISVEEVVDNYLVDQPDAIFQIADKLGLEFDQDADGLPDPATQDAVKAHLVEMAAAYAKNQHRDMVVYPPRASESGSGSDSEDSKLALTPADEVTVGYGATPRSYETIRGYKFQGNEPALEIEAAASVTAGGGGEALGVKISGAKPSRIEILPYYLDGVYKRPFYKGQQGKTPAGYHPFVYFDNGTNSAWGDIENYQPTAFVSGGGSTELRKMANVKRRLLEIAASKR